MNIHINIYTVMTLIGWIILVDQDATTYSQMTTYQLQ